jgi:SulP family sulfate permease
VQAVESRHQGTRVVLDASQLISLDASGLDALEQLFKAIVHRGGQLSIHNLNDQPRGLMERSGFAGRLKDFQTSTAAAL